jgi:hypothetical protein
MALRDLRAFRRAWDLVVEREGDQQKVTVTCQGNTVLSEIGPSGKTHRVNLGDVDKLPDNCRNSDPK